MRTRAYRPEVPGRLEDRSLLSGGAKPSAHPVVLSQLNFDRIGEQIDLGFQLFARDRVVSDLRSHLYSNAAVRIPFGRVDGLGVSINRIVSRMHRDLATNDPQAIPTARNEVLAMTRAVVEARIQAGDVVVR
jgi:hypothetical protein